MLGYIVLILVIFICLFKVKKKSIFYYYSIMYLIFYGIIPLVWMINYFEGQFHINIQVGIEKLYKLKNISYLCLINYLFLLLGYFIVKKTSKNKVKVSKIKNKKVYIYSVFFFILGFFSINILVFSFGNYITAVPKIIDLRWINNRVEIPFAFMRIFNPFIIMSFYGFYSIRNTKYKKNLFLLLSFCLSIYFLILQSGRSHFIAFFLPVLFLQLRKTSKIKKLLLILSMGIFLFVMIVYGDDLRRITMGKEMLETSNLINRDEILKKGVIQLSNPIFNLLSISENTDKSGYRYGIDFFGFLNLIPKVSFKPLWKINSENFNSETSGIIVDQLTFGYYQLSLVGTFISSFIVGLSIKLTEQFFNNKDSSEIYILLEGRTILLFIGLLQHFDIEAMIRGNLSFLLFMALLKIGGKYGRIGNSSHSNL